MDKECNSTAPRVLISGGGTGGHIFPAISIADEVKKRWPQAEILFVGAEKRMEMERVPKAGYKIIGLPVMGFDRKRLWRNAEVLLKLYKSMRRARKVIKEFRPDIAVGVGGYASGPTLKAAQKANVPTLLQEQNSYAGVTNKMLAKNARKICVAYDNMEAFFPADRIVKTGNPIREDLLDCALTPAMAKVKLGFDPEKPLVLVVGGSLGSRTLNESMLKNSALLNEAGIQVLWQVGKYYESTYADAADGLEAIKKVTFIDDMALAYKAADLVVSRAGASTISELQILGKAAILVPSPNVAEDHQTKNALALVNKDAAIMVRDIEAVEKLGSEISSLLQNEAKMKQMQKNISVMALPDSASHIADCIDKIINGDDSSHSSHRK